MGLHHIGHLHIEYGIAGTGRSKTERSRAVILHDSTSVSWDAMRSFQGCCPTSAAKWNGPSVPLFSGDTMWGQTGKQEEVGYCSPTWWDAGPPDSWDQQCHHPGQDMVSVTPAHALLWALYIKTKAGGNMSPSACALVCHYVQKSYGV